MAGLEGMAVAGGAAAMGRKGGAEVWAEQVVLEAQPAQASTASPFQPWESAETQLQPAVPSCLQHKPKAAMPDPEAREAAAARVAALAMAAMAMMVALAAMAVMAAMVRQAAMVEFLAEAEAAEAVVLTLAMLPEAQEQVVQERVDR